MLMDFTKFLKDNLIFIFSYNGPASATLKFDKFYSQSRQFVNDARNEFASLYWALDKATQEDKSEEESIEDLYNICMICWNKLNKNQSPIKDLSLKEVLALLNIMEDAWEQEPKAFLNFYKWYLETKYGIVFEYHDYGPGFPNRLQYFCPATTSQVVINTLEAKIFKKD